MQRFVWGNMGRRKESINGQQRIACEQKVLLSCNVKNCAAVELQSANTASFDRIFLQFLLFVGVHNRSVQMLVGF